MTPESFEYDYVVLGSGASGATLSVTLAEFGFKTAIVEEGKWYHKEDFKEELYTSIIHLFRNHGMQMAHGSSVMPVLEGRCVGGSTVLNGAIVHRLGEEVYNKWAERIPSLRQAIAFELIEETATSIESDLNIKRNLGSILHSLPASRALRRLGWEHQAMLRNAPGCRGSGRCLQGCPTGGKWSMEASFIPRAIRAGAEILTETRAIRILFNAMGKAEGVLCQDANGKALRLMAKRGVIVATGVIQTPLLLWRSGLKKVLPHLGRHFQTHLGVGIIGKMDRPVRELEGPPQGIEITGFKEDGYKLATQSIPLELLLSRTPLAGRELVKELGEVDFYSSWMASIQSDAEGAVGPSWTGKPSIRFEPSRKDLAAARQALYQLSTLLFEMGAKVVYPGVSGPQVPMTLSNIEDTKKILTMPLNPKYFWLSAGHLFGTARMGNNSKDSVVGTNFEVHGAPGLFVVDASIFPTNLGVNPQHSVMTLARVAANGIATGRDNA